MIRPILKGILEEGLIKRTQKMRKKGKILKAEYILKNEKITNNPKNKGA